MAAPIYCPRGSPSLLHGDFYENVARLKDFSWSVFFSSPPVTDATQSSVRSALMTELLYELPRTAVLLFLGAMFAFFVHKMVSCIRVTRKLTVTFGVCAFVYAMFFFVWMLIWRADLQNVEFARIGCLIAYFMIGCSVVFVKFLDVQPSHEELRKFRPLPVRLFCTLVAILIFFFLPPIHPESMGCPSLRARLAGEALFWLLVIFLSTVCITFENMWQNLVAQEFDIEENGVYVGKYVKKGEFGWTIQYKGEKKSKALIS